MMAHDCDLRPASREARRSAKACCLGYRAAVFDLEYGLYGYFRVMSADCEERHDVEWQGVTRGDPALLP